uniref:Major facilitator superfamily (MFS) profile domain-containing protein n=1 Tax=Strigamia maritima TaxID=126957 RepID=T1ISH1_STRMM
MYFQLGSNPAVVPKKKFVSESLSEFHGCLIMEQNWLGCFILFIIITSFPTKPLIVYSSRWIVLAFVMALNLLWISFAPISNAAAIYYDVTIDAINWLSTVVFVVTIPFIVIASKLSNSKELKFMVPIYAGALSNIIGAAVRVVGSLDNIPKPYLFYLTMAGQIIIAMGQPFIYSIPTRVSEVWFPDNQRTISTTAIAMANPLGCALSNIISPIILEHHGIFYICHLLMNLQNVFWTVCACIFGLGTFVLIRDSKPPTPPSLSANTLERNQSYGVSIKQLFMNSQYIILIVVTGIVYGAVSGIQTLIDQFLCQKGYSNVCYGKAFNRMEKEFAGLCGMLLNGIGIIGAVVFGVIADKTKKLEELTKISFGGGAISGAVLVMVSFIMFGFFVMATFPLALELAAETTYPVNETLSAGFVIISGQILSILFIIVLDCIGGSLKQKDLLIQTCTTSDDTSKIQDMTNAEYLVSVCLTLGLTIFSSDVRLATTWAGNKYFKFYANNPFIVKALFKTTLICWRLFTKLLFIADLHDDTSYYYYAIATASLSNRLPSRTKRKHRTNQMEENKLTENQKNVMKNLKTETEKLMHKKDRN